MYCRTTAIPSVCGRQKCIPSACTCPVFGSQQRTWWWGREGGSARSNHGNATFTMVLVKPKNEHSNGNCRCSMGQRSYSFLFSIAMWNKPRVWSNYLFQVQNWRNMTEPEKWAVLTHNQPSLAVHSARKQSMIHKENLGSKLTWNNTEIPWTSSTWWATLETSQNINRFKTST